MAGATLSVFFAVIAVFLCNAAVQGESEVSYKKILGLRGIPSVVSGSTTDIEVKFIYQGLHLPGTSGKWKMSAYGSATNNPGDDSLIQVDQILSQADQDAGDDVDFQPTVVLKGLDACGVDSYACFIVYRGGEKINSACLKFSPAGCPVAEDTNDYRKWMGLRGIPKLVSASETEVKFYYKGLHVQRPGDSGKWKMSVYGSDTDNSGREDLIEVDQVLSQADQDAGYDVDFRPDAILTGMNGCSGGNNYACFIVYKGEAQKNTACLKFTPDCRVLTQG
ncbi:uncharacterized protein [Asterias amurensis]|uniref:uncharacterized protein n=1 Tax=Asterias amurensis TaxID=7602 RepID=UPI003AB9049C